MNKQQMEELASAVAESIYRDAERYRWLRAWSCLIAGAFGGIGFTTGTWRKSPEDMRLLDERIDALMAAKEPTP